MPRVCKMVPFSADFRYWCTKRYSSCIIVRVRITMLCYLQILSFQAEHLSLRRSHVKLDDMSDPVSPDFECGKRSCLLTPGRYSTACTNVGRHGRDKFLIDVRLPAPPARTSAEPLETTASTSQAGS